LKRSAWSEPALIVAVLQAAVAMVVALKFNLTAGQTGAIEAVAAALGALIVALSVRPFAVPTLTGLITAGGTLLAAFGVHHATSGSVSTFNLAVAAVLALGTSLRVTPVVNAPPSAVPHP
jgi:hypothetical protein